MRTAMASSQSNRSSEHCIPQEEDLWTSPDLLVLQLLCPLYQDKKLTKLVPILLHKFQNKKPITKREIQHNVEPRHRRDFIPLFKAICECMCLAFGIDVQKVDSHSKKYVLLPILGLTYNGMLGDDLQSISKINLLVVILIIIFWKGNHISEVDLGEFLRRREMLPERKCFVIGEPWEFIKKDLVQLQYLEYRQVPHSDPAQYEFLWGPRTHAETSKMKVLEHLAKVNRRDPGSYTHLYAEALREEQEAAHSCAMGQ
ncbi:PREDICTED: melanoma-associated antigen 10-like [Chinchilla lanigera]|uniref:melanoma-associated antigen 10-like n=1 Tax=Chinchilla lanigera TaxID=34839 RepID=UPI00038EAF2F|nr:PREDICTED: melanoma-associated antigen 10-like [Chinchilla lanigera]XP_005406460.1 PREDICTED: melanoma-associated antigen 10-like [Chinchilla lanigera]